jgi:hypothetical protein
MYQAIDLSVARAIVIGPAGQAVTLTISTMANSNFVE